MDRAVIEQRRAREFWASLFFSPMKEYRLAYPDSQLLKRYRRVTILGVCLMFVFLFEVIIFEL